MKDQPAFIIHNLEHLLGVAAASAETRVQVVVCSPPGGANSLGPEVFLNICEIAQTRYPNAQIEAVLDCAQDAGAALSALRRGARQISVQLEPPVFDKIVEIARQSNARVRNFPEFTIDLADVKKPTETVLNQLAEHQPK